MLEVNKDKFGYYAMLPTESQRLYVPVWTMDVICQMRELRHECRRHVVAVNMTPEQSNRADVGQSTGLPDV